MANMQVRCLLQFNISGEYQAVEDIPKDMNCFSCSLLSCVIVSVSFEQDYTVLSHNILRAGKIRESLFTQKKKSTSPKRSRTLVMMEDGPLVFVRAMPNIN